MPSLSRRIVVFHLIGAASLVSCTTGDVLSWEPESDAEREMRESREALQRTVGEGSLFGAAAGAVIGAAVAGTGGGFQGARVGQFAGATAGTYVKSLQEAYSSQEQVLNTVLSDLRETNSNMENSIQAMRAALAEKNSRAEPDLTRDSRISEEAQATVQVAENYSRLFSETRSVLDSDGYETAPLDRDLSILSMRITEMRNISEALARNL